MIENKNQLKKALKENAKSIKIKRIYNFDNGHKIPVGSVGIIDTVQSNAFTVKYECLDKALWTYFNNIEVKKNNIIYYQYLSEGMENKIDELKNAGIEVSSVDKSDKINADYGKYRNFLYIAKFPYIVNEIEEVL